MNASLPPEISVHELGQGKSYELPVRPLGHLHKVGWIPIAFGCCWSGFSGLWVAIAFAASFHRGDGFHLQEVLFPLFGIPFVIVGLIPVAIGMFILRGSCQVELDGQRLRVVEKARPFWWTRSLSLDRIRRFEVLSGLRAGNPQPAASAPWSVLSAIKADMEGRPPIMLAMGYPHAWMLALAQDLSNRIPSVTPMSFGNVKPAVVEITADARLAAQTADRPNQPPGSKVKVESLPNGVMLTLPPRGIWRGSKGLFGFSLLLCGFMAVVTAIVCFAPRGIGKSSGSMVILVFALFWTVGLGMLLGAVNMGRRRAVMAAAGGMLKIAQASPFGKKKWEWTREQIQSIQVGPSGMEVNHRPILELQIQPAHGPKTGLFAGREEEELLWLATSLRQTLRLPERN